MNGRGGGSADLVMIVGGGVIVGLALLLAGALEAKWTIFIVLAISALLVILIFPEREKFFLYTSVLFLPLKLDFHFIYIRPLLYRPVNGILVTGFDLPFIFLMMAWAFRLFMNPGTRVRFYPWVTVPFLFMWLMALIGLPGNSAEPVVKMMTTWVMFQNLLVFLYVANNVRNRRTIYTLVAMFMLTLLLQSGMGLAQRFTGGLLGAALFGEQETSFAAARVGFGLISRVGGTLGHPNRLAGYLGLLLPVAFALLASPMKNQIKLLLLGVTALAGLTDIFTLSRGGWLGLAVGGTATLFLVLSRWTKSRVVSIILVSAIVTATFVTAVVFVEPIRRRVFEADYGAALTRLPLMEVAGNVIYHNTFTGVGLGDYAHKAVSYDTTKEAIYSQFPHPVHNAFLLIAGELGVPALIAFLFILGVMFWRLIWLGRSRSDPLIPYIAYGFFGGLVAWSVHHQIDWEYVLLITRYWFIFGLVQAMYTTVREAEARNEDVA